MSSGTKSSSQFTKLLLVGGVPLRAIFDPETGVWQGYSELAVFSRHLAADQKELTFVLVENSFLAAIPYRAFPSAGHAVALLPLNLTADSPERLAGDVGFQDAAGSLFITGKKSGFAKVIGLRLSLDDVGRLASQSGAAIEVERSKHLEVFTSAPAPRRRSPESRRIGSAFRGAYSRSGLSTNCHNAPQTRQAIRH